MTLPRHRNDAQTPGDRNVTINRRETRLRVALAFNVCIVVAQLFYGMIAHSLGLLADATHNITDVGALALSLYAIRVARRRPTAQRTFGWHRGTVLAAQANALSILIVTAWIGYEGIRRLIDPPEVRGGTVVVVAAVAFLANGIAALALREQHSHGRTDLNMRSATLHLFSDALASFGVAVAGVVMLTTNGWNWLDPAVSLAIGLSIAWHALKLLRAANSVLLEGTPDHLELALIEHSMTDTDGVETVHDLHVWTIASDMLALSAHIVIVGQPSLQDAQLIATEVKARLARDYAITHATLELECETCEDLGPACEINTFQASTVSHHGHTQQHAHRH